MCSPTTEERGFEDYKKTDGDPVGGVSADLHGESAESNGQTAEAGEKGSRLVSQVEIEGSTPQVN